MSRQQLSQRIRPYSGTVGNKASHLSNRRLLQYRIKFLNNNTCSTQHHSHLPPYPKNQQKKNNYPKKSNQIMYKPNFKIPIHTNQMSNNCHQQIELQQKIPNIWNDIVKKATQPNLPKQSDNKIQQKQQNRKKIKSSSNMKTDVYTTQMTTQKNISRIKINKPDQKKKSLRQMKVNQEKINSQVHLYLKFIDLKHSFDQNIQNIQKNDKKKTIQFETNEFSYNKNINKYLCYHQRQKSNLFGCQCSPKCKWINLWLAKYQYFEQDEMKIQTINFNNAYKLYYKRSLKENKDENLGDNIQCFRQLTNLCKKMYEQINKDIPRTQSTKEIYKLPMYRKILQEVLIKYCSNNDNLGYFQGMNIIASVIVYHAKEVNQACKIMQMLFNKLNYRIVYANEFQGSKFIAELLIYALKCKCYDLYSHLITYEVQIQMFISGWLFSMLGSFIPLQFMHLIINSFVEKGIKSIIEIILTLLIYMKKNLMSMESNEEIMIILSMQSMIQFSLNLPWQSIIQYSQAIMLKDDILTKI